VTRRLLILGGTTEAAALARAAVARFGDALAVTTSLAGRIPPSQDLAGEVRVGGFGGADGIVEYLDDSGTDLVVDATHPLAAEISRHAEDACARTGTPRLMLIRPPWQPARGDDWMEVDGLDGAAAALPGIAQRVFLTTGPGGIGAFSHVQNVWFLVRTFEPPAIPLPLADHAVVVARPPFTVEGEVALLTEHRIDTVVSKQSGGPTDAKLAAARAVGARVIMVRRPEPPAGERAETVEAAVDWIAARL